MNEQSSAPHSNWQRTRCYATAIRRADRAINRIYDQALRGTGLTCAQLSLLRLIQRAPGDVTISDLADAQVMDRTTLSRNLTNLEKSGYVRISHGEDRRTRFVHLSTQAEEAVLNALPKWEDAQKHIESDHGLTRMMHLLDELAALASTPGIDSSEERVSTQ